MPFISFTPSTQIKSADVNSNFTNAVHLTDTQKTQNKINVPATASYTPAGAATATLDCAAASIHLITMPAGNITIALSNITTNQFFQVEITQDAVGGRTVTWFSGISWAGGIAPTLSITGSKKDVFAFRCTGTNAYLGVVVAQNV